MTAFLTVWGAVVSCGAAGVALLCLIIVRIIVNDIVEENTRRLERRAKLNALRERARRVRGEMR